MFPVIVCIAKREQDYIEEFVRYHLALGFKHIFIYDNEDIPTYEALLHKYKDHMTVIHLPFNNYYNAVQYVALDHFGQNYISASYISASYISASGKKNITHVAHIDIDEFIVLKKHDTICEFIREYIVGDCEGIGMNWRFFGSSGRTHKTDEPVTKRFTMCQMDGDPNIKTLFKTDHFVRYKTVHDVILTKGSIQSTNKTIINGPFNSNMVYDVIQLNHYKCKTFPEYQYIRERGRADMIGAGPENLEEDFQKYNLNELEDLTACKFYQYVLAQLYTPII